METLLKIVQTVNMYLSDYVLVILLIGAGLYFTIRTKFVQVRCFGEGWRRFFGEFSLNGEKHKAGMSSFQALATAVAAQVGTGNIVGACGAILIGGPGAIFWMWFIAFFGMATIYAEAVLAQETRVVEPDGTILGGPVYYIKHAFPNGFGKFLAGFFAVAIILALGFMGSMVQSNSIGEACQNAFHIPSWVMGLIVCAIAAFIFIGGVQRIASVTEKIVPVMACLYLLGGFMMANQEQWHHAHALVKVLREMLPKKPGFPCVLLLCGNREDESLEILRTGLADMMTPDGIGRRIEIYGREHVTDTKFIGERLLALCKEYSAEKTSQKAG